MILVFGIGSDERREGPNRSHQEDLLARMQERRQAEKLDRIRSAAQVSTPEQRSLDQKRKQDEIRKQSEKAAIWNEFTRTERRDLKLRKDGQLARMLGKPLPGEPPALLRQLAEDDRRQAEGGMVALMSGGKTVYKNIGDLSPEDMPARIAANRLRVTWLKERRDQWLGRWELPL